MARLEATHNIFINSIGYIERGEVFEIPDKLVDARIRANCINADGSPITIEQKSWDSMTLAELKAKAQMLNIPVGPKTTRATIIELIENAESIPTTIV